MVLCPFFAKCFVFFVQRVVCVFFVQGVVLCFFARGLFSKGLFFRVGLCVSFREGVCVFLQGILCFVCKEFLVLFFAKSFCVF